MSKFIIGLVAATAVAAPIALAATPANAAPAAPKLNHGQCVSSSVRAGVTGAAHEAIAQNNALVGEYGTSTCPLVVPAAPPAADIEVQAPVFGYDSHTCSVTVPYIKGIETRLYGVNGYPQENPITGWPRRCLRHGPAVLGRLHREAGLRADRHGHHPHRLLQR